MSDLYGYDGYGRLIDAHDAGGRVTYAQPCSCEEGYEPNFTGLEWVPVTTASVENTIATHLAQDIRPEDPYKWFIDIGPFFDRFGVALMPVLTSTDAVVTAILKNMQVRKWIDLKRADVSQTFDILIAKGISGVTTDLKTAVLTTPVTDFEQIALKKLYF